MGISGLLNLLKPVTEKMHIKEYAGQTVAIDGHVLLHRGAFGAASKLANNQTTDSYVQYFMLYIGLFFYFGVIPLVVFDGLPLPLKQTTNNDRRSKRDAKLAEGMRYQFQGDHQKAQKCFQQSVSISEDMIRAIILELQKRKVQVIVAPYESDAQLAHLLKTNKAAAVVSEDSDLLVFGCSRVIYKLTREGEGEQIKYEDIFTLNQEKLDQLTPDSFRQMCMLSGCDYLPSLSGMGLKTAIKKIRHDFSIDTALRSTAGSSDRYLDYRKEFDQAEMGFLYQWVYDSDEKDYIRLNPLPEHIDEAEADKLLGTKPTVKDLGILRVNKIIPKKRSRDTMEQAQEEEPQQKKHKVSLPNHTQTINKAISKKRSHETMQQEQEEVPQQKKHKVALKDHTPTIKKAIITLSVNKMRDIHVQPVHTNQNQFNSYFQHKQSSFKTQVDIDESYLRSSIYTQPNTPQTKTADIAHTTTYASWVFVNKHKSKQKAERPPTRTSRSVGSSSTRSVLSNNSIAIINEVFKYCEGEKENIPPRPHNTIQSGKKPFVENKNK